MAKVAFPHVSPATRKAMRANKGKDTKPEMAVRRLVHGMGGDPLDHRFATHAGTRKGKAGALPTRQASSRPLKKAWFRRFPRRLGNFRGGQAAFCRRGGGV